MKKLFVTFITFMFIINLNAQPDIIDSSQVIRVVDKILKPTDFNVLLSKSIKQNFINNLTLDDYDGFVDTSLDNTYRKVNDSVYEIFINNPCKNIFLVYNNLDWHYYNYASKTLTNDNSLPADNSAYILSKGINRIRYKTGNKMITYDVLSFNPFFNKTDFYLYKVTDPKSSRKGVITIHSNLKTVKEGNKMVVTGGTYMDPPIRKFIFHYKFPKPLLVNVTTDPKLINQKKENPSISANIDKIEYDANKKFDSVFSKNSKAILLIFDHFARSLRAHQNEQLQYKLDNSTDWSYTAIAYLPSILLENVAVGKHILYVKYPAEEADILEYYFQIVPN